MRKNPPWPDRSSHDRDDEKLTEVKRLADRAINLGRVVAQELNNADMRGTP